jgi:hypothetical protein
MKNLLSFEQFKSQSSFQNEAKENSEDSKEIKNNFHRTYSMSSTWWALWKKENEADFEYKQDAFTKTFEVYTKGDKPKLAFVFDYVRNIVFTNYSPKMFELGRINPEEKAKAEETDAETGKKEEIPGDETSKEAEAEGELTTDKTDEEE